MGFKDTPSTKSVSWETQPPNCQMPAVSARFCPPLPGPAVGPRVRRTFGLPSSPSEHAWKTFPWPSHASPLSLFPLTTEVTAAMPSFQRQAARSRSRPPRPGTPPHSPRMRVIPRVSFSRCGLLQPTSGGGDSSCMARVPAPRASRAAAGTRRGSLAGRWVGHRLRASAVELTACREL